MQVGDRVRCIQAHPIGPEYGVVGQIYTISAMRNNSIRINDTGNRLCNENRFEVVRDEAAVVGLQAEQGLVLYTVVFVSASSGLPVSNGYSTEQAALTRKRDLERYNTRVLGMKKITLRGMGA